MDAARENIALSKVPEEETPARSQFPKNRGKSATPPLCKKVIVYDGDQKTVKVTSEKNVISSTLLC